MRLKNTQVAPSPLPGFQTFPDDAPGDEALSLRVRYVLLPIDQGFAPGRNPGDQGFCQRMLVRGLLVGVGLGNDAEEKKCGCSHRKSRSENPRSQGYVRRGDVAQREACQREVRLQRSLLTLSVRVGDGTNLSGTEKLHGGPPARTLAALVLRIEREVGVTASIGLSYNKFLAKIASDLDKPRGFACVGEAEALDFLGEKPVGTISGVGQQLQSALARDGITLIRHLRRYEETELMARFGAMGRRLHAFAWGRDPRPVAPNEPAKSISGETTFDDDVDDADELLRRLWPQCERVARRLKAADLAGQTVTLKLKTRDFKTITRAQKLSDPTNMADRLYRTAEPLLRRECDGRKFRLIGIGAGDLTAGVFADPPDLLDPDRGRRKKVESAIDAVRARLGEGAITKGRGFRGRE